MAIGINKEHAVCGKSIVDCETGRVKIEGENERLRDALRRILPMAHAWFELEFRADCAHEAGECQCDRKEYAETDINIAIAALLNK